MRVAVTGASGFIGRHVLAELASQRIEVSAIVRPHSNSADVLGDVDVINMDLHDAPPNAYELMGSPDGIIHLAWEGLPNYLSPQHFERELPAQYRLLKGLVESGLQTLVVAGTCFEYGMQSGPLDEALDARPNTPYGFAKDMLRRQLGFLKCHRDFALNWARLFYLYGEGQPESALLAQLRKAVKDGERVFDMTGGEQLRDYLPVADAANHLVSLALARADPGIVNVCSGRPVSVRTLVEKFKTDHGWSIELNCGYYDYKDYEPMAFWGTRHKLDSLLEPK